MQNKTNEMLVAIIASYRILGINETQAIEAMEALVNRKANGSDFDYNTAINNIVEKAPKPQLKKLKNITPDLLNVFKNVRNR